jgi:hypothetical protein
MIIPTLCCDEDNQGTPKRPSKQEYTYFWSGDVPTVLNESSHLENIPKITPSARPTDDHHHGG